MENAIETLCKQMKWMLKVELSTRICKTAAEREHDPGNMKIWCNHFTIYMHAHIHPYICIYL